MTLRWREERSRALLTELSLQSSTMSSEGDVNTREDTVFVVNVHLEGSPYRAADRVSQLRHALHRLAHHIETTGRDIKTAKLILVGDFNSLPGDSPCKFLREKHLPAGYRDEYLPGQDSATDHDIDQPFELVDAYEAANAEPPFTRKVNKHAGARLDFVWVSPGLDVLGVMRPLPMEYRELVERVGLPNYALPSDHLPVGAVVRLKDGDTSLNRGIKEQQDEGFESNGSDYSSKAHAAGEDAGPSPAQHEKL